MAKCFALVIIDGLIIAISLRIFEDIPQSIVNILHMTRNPDEVSTINIAALSTTMINIVIAILLLFIKGREMYEYLMRNLTEC